MRYQAALHPDALIKTPLVSITHKRSVRIYQDVNLLGKGKPVVVKPDWLRVKAPQWERVGNVKGILRDLGLNTVCEEASCPNIGECFNAGTATFLIMGPACTRACPYCDIDFEKKPQPLDITEPERLAEAVRRMNLNHVVITSVNRDDLPDGGASQFVRCIDGVRSLSPQTTIEVLIPDLCGNWDALEIILQAKPEVSQPQYRNHQTAVSSGSSPR